MKIALCFSGAIRDFHITIPFIKKYIMNNLSNIDIFLHMWIIDDIILSELDINFKIKKSGVTSIKEIINILNPKKWIIDKYNKTWETKIKNICGINFNEYNTIKDKNYAYNACSMYYKIMKCNELKIKYEKENNFKYDIVIRARTDYFFTDYIYLSDIKTIKENQLLILSDKYNCTWKKTKFTNDKFFIGTSNTMDNICNLFNNIVYYYNTKKCIIEGQSLFMTHTKICNMEIKKINDQYTYYKCMNNNSHIYKKKSGIQIYINDIDNIFLEYIAFKFLIDGIKIISNRQNNNLSLFSNFKICNFNKINNYDFVLLYNKHEIYSDNVYILINCSIKHDKSYNYTINNLYNGTINNGVIYYDEIYDFIKSSIKFDTPNSYIFYTSFLVYPNKNELVDFLVPDIGFYSSTINNVNNHIYVVEKYGRDYNNIPRNKFKISNLVKYYKYGLLPSNYDKIDLIKKYEKFKINSIKY
jgi:hypothetical protein